MLDILDPIRGISFVSIICKLFLAVLCGGIVGLEREHKRRPAGFRTHILVSLGAAITLITGQYLVTVGFTTDPGRLGAQVVAGIGFLGAGTIIVTKNRQVKGLTTAAGLWASAIVGLGIGAGYYEAALSGTAIILIAEMILARFEYFIMTKSKEINLFLEYRDSEALSNISKKMNEFQVKVLSLEVTKQSKDSNRYPCAIYSVQLLKKSMAQSFIDELSAVDGVVSVEEL